MTDLSIVPMPAPRVPAYFRHFEEWYAQSWLDVGQLSACDAHAQVAAYLKPYLGADGLPGDSTVFDILVEGESDPVGATWCGAANLGFGAVFYVHDLRIYAPYRRRGYGALALATLVELARERSGAAGIGLSVLARNPAARTLYDQAGFEPLSHVLFKSF